MYKNNQEILEIWKHNKKWNKQIIYSKHMYVSMGKSNLASFPGGRIYAVGNTRYVQYLC